MNEPLKIVPSKTDVEVATEFKDRVSQAVQPLLAIMGEAKRQGFDIAFNVGPGPVGLPVLTALKVSKEF